MGIGKDDATATRSPLAADLRRIASADQVFDGIEDRTLYAYDGTSLKALPDAIAQVRSAGGSGGGTPLRVRSRGSGGSARRPARAYRALRASPRRDRAGLAGMRNIKEIDASSMMAVVEPGVITGVFQKTVEDAGLFYRRTPPASTTAPWAGTSPRNAGGPHGVKYGVTKDYVWGLEVVVPSGERDPVGRKADQKRDRVQPVQLFVGSEGTLGVITEATLRLLPKPPARRRCLPSSTAGRCGDGGGGNHGGRRDPGDAGDHGPEEHQLRGGLPQAGLPRDAEAILLIEVDGMPAAVEAEAKSSPDLRREGGPELPDGQGQERGGLSSGRPGGPSPRPSPPRGRARSARISAYRGAPSPPWCERFSGSPKSTIFPS